MKPNNQKSPYQNPWPIWTQLILMTWRASWLIFCSWTPKFLNPWRLIILRLFGAKIEGIPFVHSTARIEIPWHLNLQHRACLGSRVNAYSLGLIEIHEGATVAQESYLCTGTHDFENPTMQLITEKIIIGKNSFIGARTMVLPGVEIGENAIIGAQSVATKDVPANVIFAGNPARKIGERKT